MFAVLFITSFAFMISQNVFQTATGQVYSTHNGMPTLVDAFSYPLNINFTTLTPDGSSCESPCSVAILLSEGQRRENFY